jgi:hypothetical protein
LAYSFTLVDRAVGFPTHFLSVNAGEAIRFMGLFLLAAVLLTTVLAWLASIWPAARGAFSAQRTLLASGRA